MSPSTSPIAADLLADGPHPDLAERLMVFGRFVGTWDLRVRFYDDDENVVFDEPGTWAFGWVLDGRAIQDVLTYPVDGDPHGAAPGRRGIGSSLRYLDPRRNDWRVIWVGAVSGFFVVLRGGEVEDGILLESEPEADGTLNRWRFGDITDDGFRWTGHESRDGGVTWRLRQRMEATRRAGA